MYVMDLFGQVVYCRFTPYESVLLTYVINYYWYDVLCLNTFPCFFNDNDLW